MRVAPVALSLAGTRLRPATLAFVGWFGPRGLTSILYARIVVGERLPVAGPLESIVTLSVLLSTVLHGVTACARAPGAHPLRQASSRAATTRIARDRTAPTRVTDVTAPSPWNGRADAVNSGSDAVFTRTIKSPASIHDVANARAVE